MKQRKIWAFQFNMALSNNIFHLICCFFKESKKMFSKNTNHVCSLFECNIKKFAITSLNW